MSDEFEKKLLTDGGKWWEFLDPETYEVTSDLPTADRAMSDRLDWSKRRKLERRGPVGFGFFVHCSVCGNPVPPDFVFCVRCGGEPRSRHSVSLYSLVIDDTLTERARTQAVEAVAASMAGIERAELEQLFAAPPVVFNLTARQDQMATIVAKLAEIDVPARSFPVTDPSVPWAREALESIVRRPMKLLLAVSVIAITVLLALQFTWFALVLGLAALAGLLAHELRWYKRRYHLDAVRLIEQFTGFDEETVALARDTLRGLRDHEVREHVTICLMEYYSLTNQLRAHEPIYGAVLTPARRSLRELIIDVLSLASRYAAMETFVARNPPAGIRQQIAELEEAADLRPAEQRTRAETVEMLRGQLRSIDTMERTRGAFRERISMLATQMEHLRARVSAVRARPSEDAWREAEIESALRELDAEFGVFEETFAAVSR